MHCHRRKLLACARGASDQDRCIGTRHFAHLGEEALHRLAFSDHRQFVIHGNARAHWRVARVAHECHTPRVSQHQHGVIGMGRQDHEIEQVGADAFAHPHVRQEFWRDHADPGNTAAVQERFAAIQMDEVVGLGEHQQSDPAACVDCQIGGIRTRVFNHLDPLFLQHCRVRTIQFGMHGRTQDQNSLVVSHSLGNIQHSVLPW